VGARVNHINFLFLGIGNGAVFGALAVALVVTYRSSGVINFAVGAIAMYGAYAFAFLRRGQFLQVLPGLPRRIDLPWDAVPFVPALIIATALSALLGAVAYFIVFRPLRHASAIARTVASVGLLTLLTGLVAQAAGQDQVNVRPIFPQRVYTFGSLRISGDRVWLALTIVAIAIGLAAFYRFTRLGLATRAAAENEEGAIVSGLKPERIALVNWAISSAIAGLAGILISPLLPLVPGTYTLFVIPALAAAVLGRMTSFTIAVLGGIAIGMLQSEAAFISSWSWTLKTGNAELIPMLLVLAILIAHGQPLPSRGALVERLLGRAPRPRHIVWPAAIWAAVGVLALTMTTGNLRAAVIMSMILAVIALSLVVVTGYAGQVSFAQLTLAGVGAFLVAALTTKAGIPFPLAPLLAAAGATIVGVVVGMPALRIRGMHVAVVTLLLALAVEASWFRNNDFNGGSAGASVEPASFLGIDLGIGQGSDYPRWSFGLMVLLVLIVTAIGVALLRRSPLGVAMMAVRSNERSAAAAGISVVKVKILAFAIGSFIAGLGGTLLAYRMGTVTSLSFEALAGLALLAAVYIAGIGSISGAVIAGVMAPGGILIVLIERGVHIGQWHSIVAGAALIFTVIKNPVGIAGEINRVIEHSRAKRRPIVDVPARLLDQDQSAERRDMSSRSDVILAVSGLSVRYGGVVAISDVSFDVKAGRIVGLIGPNGAGKTSLIDAVTGFTRHDGSVDFAGRDMNLLPPHRRVQAGMSRTFQGIDLYEDLTVEENLAVGQYATDQSAGETERMLVELIQELGLEALRDRRVGELSQGERQLVSIARALGTQPQLVLLDEPAAGLDSSESQWLATRLRHICRRGLTILLVDHDVDLVFSVCDEVLVLDLGRLIFAGTPADARRSRAVSEAYLGSSGDVPIETLA
jgi:ABC-type branched-subunit amino acid transport system ATPase component/branched-subunit amino acid ABC-type transport system permease component